MTAKPKCDHKPNPGYRELFGEERKEYLKQMEEAGYLTTVRRAAHDLPVQGTCLHIYVKINPK